MHHQPSTRGDDVAGRGDPGTGPGRTEDHQSGRLLDGRYLIGSRIARGGMASVYEATDTRLDRTVAVKIMHPGLGDATTQDDESFARRFVREARSAARLSHPNVVNVFDQGRDEADGTVYLVMEYVAGHTLRDTISKEAPMSPERALATLDPVLAALGAAHRAGLVHRDVKPENVLIATEPHSGESRVKVADFGLARAVTAETAHTATTGVLIGTVSYLAPELVVEQQADARADVYAAGVILFELLTGTKPHTGETPIAVAYRHVHHDVPAPSTLVPGLPAYVDALVARATTRDPSLRPADATVLQRQMHRVAQALHAGVREDAELVADLTPATRTAPIDGADGADEHDTTPEPVSSLWEGVPGLVDAPAAPRFSPEAAPRPTAAPADPDGETTSVIGAPPPASGRPAAPRRRRKRIAIGVVLALLVAAVAAGGYWFGWGRYISTPGVVGLELAAAEAELADAELGTKVEEVHSDSVETGDVISTDPGPGARILPGADVTLVVSLGPEVYDVPDLGGLTLDQAEEELAQVKLVVGRVTKAFSESVAEGEVIRSIPAYGTPAAEALPVNTAVKLVLSKGRKPIKVGNWVGKDAEQAEKVLERRGLQVKVSDSEFSDDIEKGHVISQDPRTGTLFRGDTVDLVVSKGPELVTVPKVRYNSTDEAIRKLEDLGFKVETERATIYLSGQVAWDTRPGGGTRARKGSTIILVIV